MDLSIKDGGNMLFVTIKTKGIELKTGMPKPAGWVSRQGGHPKRLFQQLPLAYLGETDDKPRHLGDLSCSLGMYRKKHPYT